MSTNDTLLKAIRGRRRKRTEFGYGILTADSYVRTLQKSIGLDNCYKFAAGRGVSFDDLLRKAAKTLVYSNSDMELERATSSCDFKELMKGAPEGVELPKNTLSVIRHVLTSSRKDRDGDVLRSDGAIVDGKMLLIWQHVHTLPLGKYLYTVDKDTKALRVVSAIVDINELSHDAAVMADNGMARFSHGFRALKFDPFEEKDEEPDMPLGFDVKEFEIMEESMVSVPSNVDADTEEVLLSLVEDGKLTSPIVREYGRAIRDRRPTSMPGVEIKYKEQAGDVVRELSCGSLADLKAANDAGLIGGKNDEDESGDRGEAGGEGKPRGSPEKADDESEERKEAKEAGDAEMIGDKPYPNFHACRLRNPGDFKEGSFRTGSRKHGGKTYSVIMGKLKGETTMTEQAYRYAKSKWDAADARSHCKGHKGSFEAAAGDEDSTVPDFEKAGRVLSKANEMKLRNAVERIEEASRTLLDVLSVLGEREEEERDLDGLNVKRVVSFIHTETTPEERKTLRVALKAIEEAEERDRRTEQYRAL